MFPCAPRPSLGSQSPAAARAGKDDQRPLRPDYALRVLLSQLDRGRCLAVSDVGQLNRAPAATSPRSARSCGAAMRLIVVDDERMRLLPGRCRSFVTLPHPRLLYPLCRRHREQGHDAVEIVAETLNSRPSSSGRAGSSITTAQRPWPPKGGAISNVALHPTEAPPRRRHPEARVSHRPGPPRSSALHHLQQRGRWQIDADRPPAVGYRALPEDQMSALARGARSSTDAGRRARLRCCCLMACRPGAAGHHHRRLVPIFSTRRDAISWCRLAPGRRQYVRLAARASTRSSPSNPAAIVLRCGTRKGCWCRGGSTVASWPSAGHSPRHPRRQPDGSDRAGMRAAYARIR